jgi:hypothetical protein
MALSIFKLVLVFVFVVTAFEESDFEDLNWDSHNLWNQACEIVVNKVYANLEKNSNGMHVKVGSKNTSIHYFSFSLLKI